MCSSFNHLAYFVIKFRLRISNKSKVRPLRAVGPPRSVRGDWRLILKDDLKTNVAASSDSHKIPRDTFVLALSALYCHYQKVRAHLFK